MHLRGHQVDYFVLIVYDNRLVGADEHTQRHVIVGSAIINHHVWKQTDTKCCICSYVTGKLPSVLTGSSRHCDDGLCLVRAYV